MDKLEDLVKRAEVGNYSGDKCAEKCDLYPCNAVKVYNKALKDFAKAIIKEPPVLHDNFGCMVRSVRDRLMN